MKERKINLRIWWLSEQTEMILLLGTELLLFIVLWKTQTHGDTSEWRKEGNCMKSQNYTCPQVAGNLLSQQQSAEDNLCLLAVMMIHYT